MVSVFMRQVAPGVACILSLSLTLAAPSAHPTLATTIAHVIPPYSPVQTLSRSVTPISTTVHVAPGPAGVAVDVQANRVFVADAGEYNQVYDDPFAESDAAHPPTGHGAVSMFDATTGALLATTSLPDILVLPLGFGSGLEQYGIGVDGATGHVFVSGCRPRRGSCALFMLDATTDMLARTIPLPGTPAAVLVDVATHRVFVSVYNAQGSFIETFDSERGILLQRWPIQPVSPAAPRADAGPQPFILDAARERLISGSHFLDAATGQPLPGHANFAALDAVSSLPARLGDVPGYEGMAFDNKAGHAFVATTYGSSSGAFGYLYLLDARTLTLVPHTPLNTVGSPMVLDSRAVDAGTGYAVISALPNTLQLVDTRAGRLSADVPAQAPAPGQAFTRLSVAGIVADPLTHRAFAMLVPLWYQYTLYGTPDPRRRGQLVVLSTRTGTILQVLSLGIGPFDLALDPATHRLFVANTLSDTVTVINTAALPDPEPAGPLPSDPVDRARPGALFVAETGHSLDGAFLSFWQRHGGAAVLGLPRTEPFHEAGHLVQYFAHLALRQDAGGVTVLPLGRLLTAGRTFARVASVVSTPTLRYFAATGHTLSGGFLRYWTQHDGATLLGPPLSQEIYEGLGDGTGVRYAVQWFANGRLEYHPRAAADERVQVSTLGELALQQRGWMPLLCGQSCPAGAQPG